MVSDNIQWLQETTLLRTPLVDLSVSAKFCLNVCRFTSARGTFFSISSIQFWVPLTNPFSTRCMLGFSARAKVKKVKPSKRNEKDFKPRTEEEVKAEQRSSCLEYISFSHSSLCLICVFIHCKLIQNE